MNLIIQRNKIQHILSKKPKKIISLCLYAIFASVLTPAMAVSENLQSSPALFDSLDAQQLNKKATQSARHHPVRVHTEVLQSPALTINLFERGTVIAVRDRMVTHGNGRPDTWIGHVDGEQDSEVFLTFRRKLLVGTVRIDSDVYEIKIKREGAHEITKIDLSKNPAKDDAKALEDFLAEGGQASFYPLSEADVTPSADGAGTIIDLMVVYTAKAKSNASGQAGIETKIANAVAMANQAYINSQVDMQLNVVYTGEISYVESGNMATSLSDLTGDYDGKMDAVHTLRNQYGADQVVLITSDANYCGIGYVMTNPGISFAPYAFSVVHDDSSYSCLSNGTLAHELGHNQGNTHDRASSSFPGAYDYSYGYRLCETGGFRDIMSYACTGAPRVSYFSNPNVLLPSGQVTGTSTDNTALSMNNTKAIVAAFRSATVAVPPSAPVNLIATAFSPNEIRLAWTDNSSDETGFRLERSTDGINWTEFAVTASNTTSYADTGLAASTSYLYRIRSYNSNGNSSYSNISSTKTGSTATSATGSFVIDTMPPVVNILQPTGGARVGGTVMINVKATDNFKVSSLKIFIDGRLVSVGNTSTLSYSWNTRTFSAGTHTISSQAVDTSNNIGRKSVSVIK